MKRTDFVKGWVHHAYWDNDWNCAVTTLLVLGDVFDLDVNDQLLDAALGMHGAGGYRAQCGLVEGGLMFLGVLGRARRMCEDAVVQVCYDYAQAFDGKFGSLVCRELRPDGFAPGQPPHLCEDLTCRAIVFDIDFLRKRLNP